jgi:hypothetical protein
MSTAIKTMDETRLAEEIVRVLPDGAIRLCSSDREAIRYAVRSGDLKLRTIVLGRAALRRLLYDRNSIIKIEYLQRDLLLSAGARREFAYPRPRVVAKAEGEGFAPRLARSAC